MSKIESIIMLLVAAHLSAEIVHELGHLLAARYFGVRVLRISVGLGPEIVGMSDRLGTRWSLGWIPLGSYISFVDEKCPTSGTIAIWRGVINRNSESISSRSCIQRAAIYGAGSAANMLLTPITYALCQLYFVSTLACPGVMELDSTIASTLGLYSFAVGLFNLLPLPLHDGGKLMLLCIEWFHETHGFQLGGLGVNRPTSGNR